MKMTAISTILPPGNGEAHLGISASTFYETLSCVLICDQSRCENPDELMKYLDM